MGKKQMKLIFPLCILFLVVFSIFFTLSPVDPVDAAHRHRRRQSTAKLFVFGDSFVDSGNSDLKTANSWLFPFGITFPGKPSGRFSDGRILPDYLASYLGIKSPVAYQWRKVDRKLLRYGMNFAYGGTGVFDTPVPEPNMTTQIDFFEKMIKSGVYVKQDLISSVALVSTGSNDYSTYLENHGTAQGMPAFISSVVNQLTMNLKRIHQLGIRKIAVASLSPDGCAPINTGTSSHQQCNETLNIYVKNHNSVLQKAVEELRNDNGGGKDFEFVVLDFYGSFMAALNNKRGNVKFENPLKPCCVGTSDGYYCGNLDKSTGEKKYVLCENPEKTFFWDDCHPTQEAWHSVYLALQPSLRHLYPRT